MANKIKIKRRLSTSTVQGMPTLDAGELFVNFVDNRLYAQGDQATPLEFADKSYVDGAITSATGSLGTMSTQNANAVTITGGTIDGTTIGATTPSTGKFTTIETDMGASPNIFNNQTQFGWGISGVGSNPLYVSSKLDLSIGLGVIELGGFSGCAVKGLDEPVNDNDAARKKYVDDKVSALGSAFHYVGDISSATTPLDLTTLSDLATGAYYKVDVAGTYTAGSDSFALKVGDAIVKTTTGWQKLDNVDAEVIGTANEISVTGDENVGYTVGLDSVFKGRVSDIETDVTNLQTDVTNLQTNVADLETKTQNIDLAGTSAGTTKLNGTVEVVERLKVKDVYGTDLLNIGTFDVSLGGNYPGAMIYINTNLTGVNMLNGDTPALQNFVLDGGEY